MTETFKCPYCPKVLKARGSARQHVAAKHRGKSAKMFLEPDDGEQSIADMMIEAEIARACGEPVESWIADMLP